VSDRFLLYAAVLVAGLALSLALGQSGGYGIGLLACVVADALRRGA